MIRSLMRRSKKELQNQLIEIFMEIFMMMAMVYTMDMVPLIEMVIQIRNYTLNYIKSAFNPNLQTSFKCQKRTVLRQLHLG